MEFKIGDRVEAHVGAFTRDFSKWENLNEWQKGEVEAIMPLNPPAYLVKLDGGGFTVCSEPGIKHLGDW